MPQAEGNEVSTLITNNSEGEGESMDRERSRGGEKTRGRQLEKNNVARVMKSSPDRCSSYLFWVHAVPVHQATAVSQAQRERETR